jgi:hypothetical protein
MRHHGRGGKSTRVGQGSLKCASETESDSKKTMLENAREPHQCVASQIGDLAGLRCSNWSCKAGRDPLLVKVTV